MVAFKVEYAGELVKCTFMHMRDPFIHSKYNISFFYQPFKHMQAPQPNSTEQNSLSVRELFSKIFSLIANLVESVKACVCVCVVYSLVSHGHLLQHGRAGV